MNAGSVPACRSTWYWAGVSSFCHSSSVLVTSGLIAAPSGDPCSPANTGTVRGVPRRCRLDAVARPITADSPRRSTRRVPALTTDPRRTAGERDAAGAGPSTGRVAPGAPASGGARPRSGVPRRTDAARTARAPRRRAAGCWRARRRLPLVATSLSDGLVCPDLDLDLRPRGEGGDLHRAARRPMVAHGCTVRLVHDGEIRDVGHEDGHLGDVVPTGATVGQHRRDVRQRLARLAFGPAVSETTGRGIEPDLTRQHQPITGAHGRRVRAGDGRGVRSGDGLGGHPRCLADLARAVPLPDHPGLALVAEDAERRGPEGEQATSIGRQAHPRGAEDAQEVT